MTLTERIDSLVRLGDFFRNSLSEFVQSVSGQAIAENQWFTEETIGQALQAITDKFLVKEELEAWLNHYSIQESGQKNVGLILAGNIPLVGFHDMMCTFLSGHKSLLKLSSKDAVLPKAVVQQMDVLSPGSHAYFEFVPQLSGMDAVIATGSGSAATHFHSYFSKYPHIIRKDRSSLAIIRQEDSEEDLKRLGSDIFGYFGLGCRNISKIFIPEDFILDRLFESLIDYEDVINHNKYKNNFDYSYAIYLLGNEPFLTNNFLILRENKNLASRISCVHYERYSNLDEVIQDIGTLSDELQCVAASQGLANIETTSFGQCQKPGIADYADGIDTMQFLTSLYD